MFVCALVYSRLYNLCKELSLWEHMSAQAAWTLVDIYSVHQIRCQVAYCGNEVIMNNL